MSLVHIKDPTSYEVNLQTMYGTRAWQPHMWLPANGGNELFERCVNTAMLPAMTAAQGLHLKAFTQHPLSGIQLRRVIPKAAVHPPEGA